MPRHLQGNKNIHLSQYGCKGAFPGPDHRGKNKKNARGSQGCGKPFEGNEMSIITRYNIGDTIEVEGQTYKIIAIHLYQGETTHTERYYLGDEKWVTIKGEKGQKK